MAVLAVEVPIQTGVDRSAACPAGLRDSTTWPRSRCSTGTAVAGCSVAPPAYGIRYNQFGSGTGVDGILRTSQYCIGVLRQYSWIVLATVHTERTGATVYTWVPAPTPPGRAAEQACRRAGYMSGSDESRGRHRRVLVAAVPPISAGRRPWWKGFHQATTSPLSASGIADCSARDQRSDRFATVRVRGRKAF